MTKENIKNTRGATVAIVRKAVGIAKITLIGILALTSLVGGYVLTNAELRNQTIDFAQGQLPVQAESPKGN